METISTVDAAKAAKASISTVAHSYSIAGINQVSLLSERGGKVVT